MIPPGNMGNDPRPGSLDHGGKCRTTLGLLGRFYKLTEAGRMCVCVCVCGVVVVVVVVVVEQAFHFICGHS